MNNQLINRCVAFLGRKFRVHNSLSHLDRRSHRCHFHPFHLSRMTSDDMTQLHFLGVKIITQSDSAIAIIAIATTKMSLSSLANFSQQNNHWSSRIYVQCFECYFFTLRIVSNRLMRYLIFLSVFEFLT